MLCYEREAHFCVEPCVSIKVKVTATLVGSLNCLGGFFSFDIMYI
jgi:hypothetical protein